VGPDDDPGGEQKDEDDVIVVPGFATSALASRTGAGGAWWDRPAPWVAPTAVSVLAQTSSLRLDSVVVAAVKCPELGNAGGEFRGGGRE
jgi:hypothetical protein